MCGALRAHSTTSVLCDSVLDNQEDITWYLIQIAPLLTTISETNKEINAHFQK